jgi:purine-nucleoside phosphorylase
MSIPTPHIEAKAGEIADAILLPGDPRRAQVIAETFLDGAVCYNQVRGMLGYTGAYHGRRISVQGTGMGMPSMAIYATELFRFYGVRTAIRVGSCGALQRSIKLRDVIIAMSAHTSSNMVRRRLNGLDFAPTASYELLRAAVDLAGEANLTAHVGTIYSDDAFYDENPAVFDLLEQHGTLAVEMEAAALYTIAAAEGVRALCIATVSDHLRTEEVATSEERQNGFMAMAQLALDTVIATT